MHYKTGQLILTCFLLPQTDEREDARKQTDIQQSQQQQERHICFKEANSSNENFARLMRAPTPYPKDLQRYQRSVTNILKRQKQAKTGVPESTVPQIREAVVMATNTLQPNTSEDTLSTSVAIESLNPTPVSEQPSQNQEFDDIASEFVTLRQPGPPPYHVAAMYSKNAQFFSNINRQRDSERNDSPRYFVQDQPRDILMPQPQHGLPSTVLSEIQRSVNGGGVVGNDDEGLRKMETPWMFGQHKNRRVMEFSLTPCCYVPGFSVSLGQTVSHIAFLREYFCAVRYRAVLYTCT